MVTGQVTNSRRPFDSLLEESPHENMSPKVLAQATHKEQHHPDVISVANTTAMNVSKMELLRRNETTAEEAIDIENGRAHPFRAGEHSANYFDLLAQRRKLLISGKRQEFLDVYHQAQVSMLHC